MNAKSALRGWEEEDYLENVKKLKSQANRMN
jgi:hypothetical protein